MNTLWLKTLRDLWLYKARTLLVVLAIAVGTAAVGVSITSLVVLQRDLRNGYLGSNPAHAVLSTTPFDVSMADRVADLPEVAEAQARRLTIGRLLINGETRPLQLWTIPDFEALNVGRLYPQAGALIPPPPGTLLLERSARGPLGVGQGDTVTVQMNDGDTYRLQVAGFVNDMSQPPTTVQPTVYGYLTDETAARLGLPETYDEMQLTVAAADPDRAAVEAAVTTVTDWLEDEGVVVLRAGIPQPGVHLMQGNVDTGLLMIGILGGLTLVLSAFLVTNVMSAVVAQQVPVIGVLKALGSGRGLVLRLYGRMVVIFGLLALVLALPLGLIGAYFQSSFLAGQLNYDIPSFGLTLPTLLVQLAGALLVPAVAALWPVRQAMNLTIREALGGYGVSGLSEGGGLLSRVESLPRLAALALRNVARRKVRLALTLVALSLAGAMFIATFGLRQGLDQAIEILISEFPFDVQLDFTEPQLVQRLEREALAVPGVERVESWGVADVRRVYPDGRVGSSFTLFGVPETTQISAFANRAGRWLDAADADALYISYEAEKLTQRPAPGDELSVKINGQRDRLLALVGISQKPFDASAYVPYATFERAVGDRGRAGRLVVYMDGDDPAAQAAVAAELVARFESANIRVARVDTAGSFRDSYRAQFNNLILLLMVLAALTALVGGMGLANTMALNVLERSREIGILRSMGAGRPLLRRLILAEGLAIAVISALFAVLLAVPMTLILDRIMGNSLLGNPLAFAFVPLSALAWLGLVVGIGALACWVPAERAARMTVREALAYE